MIILAALFLAAGCSQYDRALMGEPQPKAQPDVVANAQVQPDSASADSDSMDIGMFHDLDYYGQWYQRDPYGWVWRPSVVMDWQPFTHGHWIWTQYGWMWVDYDPWGWATSHYGYWYNDFTLGWVWIPDYTWSPVQCDWIEYGDYVGWAPEAPPGAAFKDPWDDQKPWVFVPVRKFKQADVASNRVAPKFKPASGDGDITRNKPALADVERKGSGLFSQVDVQLDRRVVHDREFARVKYPPDQQDIIAEHRTVSIKSTPMSSPAPVQLTPGSPYTGPGDPVPPPPTAGPVQQGPPPPSKSKGSSSQPPAKTETKYKSQKAKEPPKSKDSTPTKKGKGG